MLNMERYIDKHVILDVKVDNNVYKVKGKVTLANENLIKLATYKRYNINNRYINTKDIVGVEVITNY